MPAIMKRVPHSMLVYSQPRSGNCAGNYLDFITSGIALETQLVLNHLSIKTY